MGRSRPPSTASTSSIIHQNIVEVLVTIDDQDDVHITNVENIAKPKRTPKMKNIKMKYKPVKATKPRATKKSKAAQQKNTKKMSTIIEQKDEEIKKRPPVVSLKRLSLVDISKWMPSRRTSDTDNPQASSKIISAKNIGETPSSAESSSENTPRVKTKTAEISKLVKTRRDTFDLVKLKTPSFFLSKARILLPPMPVSEGEHSPPKKPRRELKRIYSTRSQSKVDDKETQNVTQKEQAITKTAKKQVETIIQTDTSETIETNVSSIRTRSRPTQREATRTRKLIDTETEQARPKEPKNKEQIKRNTKPASKTAARKSMISPIKLLGDFTPILDAGNSSADENVTYLRTTNVLSKSKESQISKSKSNVSKADTIITREISMPETPEIPKRKWKSPILSVSKKKSVEPQRNFEEIKASEKPKKYTIEPIRREYMFDDTRKKIQVLEDVTVARSGPSSSSVNNWFEKTDPVVIDPTLSLKDTVQNVTERLNTTLAEIDHNTSKKSLAMVDSFKEKFKTQAFELTRQDCDRRRAVVVLRREDFQAV